MKTNNRKASMRYFKDEKRRSRRVEKRAQAVGDMETVAWERWYRLEELKGSAAKDWQAHKRHLRKLGCLRRSKTFQSTR